MLALFKVFLLDGTFYRASDAPDSVSEIQKGTVARDDPRHVPTNTDEYRAETLKNFFFFFYKLSRVFNDSASTAMSLVSDPLNQAYLSPLKLSKGYGWVTQGTEVQIKTLFTFVNIRSTPPWWLRCID